MRHLLVLCLAACGPSPAPRPAEPEVFGVGTIGPAPSATVSAPPPKASGAVADASLHAVPVTSATPRPAHLAPGVGWLPPTEIQRVSRQSFGKFRLCYEQGLARDPNLKGRIAVRFIIEPSGSVSHASNGGSDLPDQAVVDCVVQAFTALSFPSPDGGPVTVVYPISFAPGG